MRVEALCGLPAHRCEPPLSACISDGSGSAEVGQHVFVGASKTWPRSEYLVVVHSQTLPIMSSRPKPLGGNVPTGEVPTQREVPPPWAPSLR